MFWDTLETMFMLRFIRMFKIFVKKMENLSYHGFVCILRFYICPVNAAHANAWDERYLCRVDELHIPMPKCFSYFTLCTFVPVVLKMNFGIQDYAIFPTPRWQSEEHMWIKQISFNKICSIHMCLCCRGFRPVC